MVHSFVVYFLAFGCTHGLLEQRDGLIQPSFATFADSAADAQIGQTADSQDES